MRTVKKLTIAAAVCVLVLGLAGCGIKSDKKSAVPAADTTTTATGGTPAGVTLTGPVTDHGTTTASGTEIELEAYDDYFESTFIKVQPNTKYTMKLHNVGRHFHTFTATNLGVDIDLPAGAHKDVTITTPATGFAEFKCKPHAGLGMRGAFVIS